MLDKEVDQYIELVSSLLHLSICTRPEVSQAVGVVWCFGIQTGAITIFSNNHGAIKLLKHPFAAVRPKHIGVIHHFAREVSLSTAAQAAW